MDTSMIPHRPVPRRHISIRLPDEQIAQLRWLAHEHGISVTALVERAIGDYIDRVCQQCAKSVPVAQV